MQQFNFLREWQNKVYEAGYLGAHWPKEYGGGGLPKPIKTPQPHHVARAHADYAQCHRP